MNHEIYLAALCIGVIVSATALCALTIEGRSGAPCWFVATLLLAWLWLPWLVYGLWLIPWSAIPRIMPPVEQTEMICVPTAGPMQVEAAK